MNLEGTAHIIDYDMDPTTGFMILFTCSPIFDFIVGGRRLRGGSLFHYVWIMTREQGHVFSTAEKDNITAIL